MQLVLFNTSIGPNQVLPFWARRGPGSNGNEGVLCIPQSSSITGTPPWDCLDSYPGNSLGHLTPLQRCSQCILQPEPTGQYTELMSKQLYLRKFSLAWVNTLDVKIVLIRAIQFSINTQFKCQNSSILNNSAKHKYAV